MISLAKYLNSPGPDLPVDEPETDKLTSAMLDCYSSALSAIAKAASQVCPHLAGDLEKNLLGLQRRLSVDPSQDLMKRTGNQVEVQLNEWGARTAAHFKTQADEVKELLITIAKTAESVASRDEGYSGKFTDLTGHLTKIADLQDLREIRSSIRDRVAELKCSIDQMKRDNRQMVAHLRAEVSTYETKLKMAEDLALVDQLTKVANRRSIEERIQSNIRLRQDFCVAMVDLNGFKKINDTYGHLVGDELLRQFAMEFKHKSRSSDLAGRWGGDEFIVVLSGNLTSAKAHIERMQQWVFGDYTIQDGTRKPIVIHIDGSVGAAEWHSGQTMEALIAEADSKMYIDKKTCSQKSSQSSLPQGRTLRLSTAQNT